MARKRKSLFNIHLEDVIPETEDCLSEGRRKYGFTYFHCLYYVKNAVDKNQNFLLAYDCKKKATGFGEIRKQGHRGKILLDSGAFVGRNKNIAIDIDTYINYVNEVGDDTIGIAILDYLPKSNSEEDITYSEETTWNNFNYMWYKVRKELRPKLIYIVHSDENIERVLKRALEWRDNEGNKIEFFGMGLSRGDIKTRIEMAKRVSHILKDYDYEGRFHLFGVQTIDIIEKMPYATSADSSIAINDAAAGRIFTEGTLMKVNSDRKIYHVAKYSKEYYDNVEHILEERAKSLGIDYHLAMINLNELYKWNCSERSIYLEDRAMRRK